MSQILNANEIKEFNKNGAILLKNKFDKKWIEKLKVGINKAKANPSPRFTNHTKDKNVPSYLEEHKLNSISTISQFNFFDEDIKMSISLNKLESRNTLNTSSDEYMDAVFYNFEVLWNKDLKKVEEIMPQNLLNDLQVADFNSYLKIDSKKFGERVSYYIDRRLDGTALENEMVTEFHYITHHNKRKYTINISYYGNNSASSFIGLSRSIAGTLKFQN